MHVLKLLLAVVDHRIVCKSAFYFLHCIGEKVPKNLHKHLKDHKNLQLPKEYKISL